MRHQIFAVSTRNKSFGKLSAAHVLKPSVLYVLLMIHVKLIISAIFLSCTPFQMYFPTISPYIGRSKVLFGSYTLKNFIKQEVCCLCLGCWRQWPCKFSKILHNDLLWSRSFNMQWFPVHLLITSTPQTSQNQQIYISVFISVIWNRCGMIVVNTGVEFCSVWGVKVKSINRKSVGKCITGSLLSLTGRWYLENVEKKTG